MGELKIQLRPCFLQDVEDCFLTPAEPPLGAKRSLFSYIRGFSAACDVRAPYLFVGMNEFHYRKVV